MAHLAVQQYQSINQQSAIHYADDHLLIQMLYEALSDHIAQASHLLEQGNYNIEQKGKLISKAIMLVEALKAYLNYEQGGQIAVNLGALYDYMERTLFEANYKNDVNLLLEVKKLVEEIKAGWIGIREEALVYLKKSAAPSHDLQ